MSNCRNSLLEAMTCFHTWFPGCDHSATLAMTTYFNCNSAAMDLSLKTALFRMTFIIFDVTNSDEKSAMLVPRQRQVLGV